jgi:hypothetical protein
LGQNEELLHLLSEIFGPKAPSDAIHNSNLHEARRSGVV